MGRIVFVGGGIVGQIGALLLARDGHDVTILERDPAPPTTSDRAWSDWERRGVAQFRLPHVFQPRFREVMEANAPEVIPALIDSGALRVNTFRDTHRLLTGGFRETDARYDAYTARRPVAEAAVAGIVEATDNITVRRGIGVTELIAGEPSAAGVPHVVGVRTDTGEDVLADLVIECGGRRTSLTERLVAIGAHAPMLEQHEGSFRYFCRHFRSDDGSIPKAMATPVTEYPTHTMMTVGADNGTWGVVMLTRADDAALRGLADEENWTRAVKGHPLHAHWLDGEPINDGIATMSKIEDERRTFVIDGVPVVTGVLALGDAWAVTHPTLGRGISMGSMHGVALRDLLHDFGSASADPVALALAWHDVTNTAMGPWFDDAAIIDDGRLARVRAALDGTSFAPSPEYNLTEALRAAMGKDHELLRAYNDHWSMLVPQRELFARPGVADLALELGGDWLDEMPPGLTREELLEICAS
jgi:2-polyprenyl-6-methoxyphenol hydroxylase-like FAD-dependent oxidoreductase